MHSDEAPGPPELFSPPVIDAHGDAAPDRGPHDDLAGQLLNAIAAARWFAGKGRRAVLTGHTKLGWLTDVDQWPAVRIEIVEVSYPPDEDPEEFVASRRAQGTPAAELDELSPELVEMSPELVEMSPELVELSPELVELNHELVEMSPELVELSPELVELNHELVEMSPELVEMSPELVEGRAVPYELYQVPVSYWPAPQSELAHAELARTEDSDLGHVVAYDAAQDPAACRILLDRLLDARRFADHDSEVRFIPTDIDGLTRDEQASPFRGQQSNTSILFGAVAMLKLFRRLELGRNLDIETHDALNKAGVADVARLYGWIEASWRHRNEDVHADLAMLVEKLAGAEDGWDLALHALAEGRSFADDAAELGRVLAGIHTALRDSFATSRGSGAETAAVMTARFTAARSIAPALDPYTDGVLAAFETLGAAELDVQRVHGDFHLGQTLRTPSGWKIIDFEGEPAKTLGERLAPDSVWRDIAGMLRSFDYAGASVSGPGAARWVADCRTAFLDAYLGGELDGPGAAFLRAYEVDKAVYEVVYEVRNRPDWVRIPLGAVAAVSGVTPTSDQTPTGEKE